MATTAQLLIAYRQELKAGGIHDELANDLVRDAASTLVTSEGLEVQVTSLDTDAPPQDTSG